MKKFPIVVLSITLVLVLASIVLTFIGAFSGESGQPLFKTGVFGIIFVPIFGWLMAASYNRVHRDDPPEQGKTPDGEAAADTEDEAK